MRKNNYKPIPLNYKDAKILNKILACDINKHIKTIIHHSHVGIFYIFKFGLSLEKSVNISHHTDRTKEKNHNYIERPRKSI